MITLKDKQKIIELHLSNKSNREISRILGLDKKTVNKYVKEFKQANQALTTSTHLEQEDIRNLTEVITSTPKYTKRNSQPRKWTVEMEEFLDTILAEEDKKCKLLRTKKLKNKSLR